MHHITVKRYQTAAKISVFPRGMTAVDCPYHNAANIDNQLYTGGQKVQLINAVTNTGYHIQI